MIRKIIGLVLFSAALAFGQGAQRISQATMGVNGYVKYVPGAAVTVCTYPDCNAVTLYQNVELTIPIPQPLYADPLGNYSYFVGPGNYSETISSPGTTPTTLVVALDTISANFSSPPPIGNVTPNTIAATVVNNEVFAINYPSLAAAIAAKGGNRLYRLSCSATSAVKYYDVSNLAITADGISIKGDGQDCARIRISDTSDTFNVQASIFSLENVGVEVTTTADRSGASFIRASTSTATRGRVSGLKFFGNASSPNNGNIWTPSVSQTNTWDLDDNLFYGGATWNRYLNIDYPRMTGAGATAGGCPLGGNCCPTTSVTGITANRVKGSAAWAGAMYYLDGYADTAPNILEPDVEPNSFTGRLFVAKNTCVQSLGHAGVTDPRYWHLNTGGFAIASTTSTGVSAIFIDAGGVGASFDNLVLGNASNGKCIEVTTNAKGGIAFTNLHLNGCGAEAITDTHNGVFKNTYSNITIQDACAISGVSGTCDAVSFVPGRLIGANNIHYLRFSGLAVYKPRYLIHIPAGVGNYPIVVRDSTYLTTGTPYTGSQAFLDESTGSHWMLNPQVAIDCTGTCATYALLTTGELDIDSLFKIQLFSGNPQIQFAANSALTYDRANNLLNVQANATTPMSFQSNTLTNVMGAGYALKFIGSTSGTGTFVPPAVFGGTRLFQLPNASGTLAVNASSPLALDATTGNLTCPTCSTGTIASTTNLLAGNGSGSAVSSGFASTAITPVYNQTGTLQTTSHTSIGTCTLNGSSPSSCTITYSGSAVFTSNATYKCALTDKTSGAAIFITYTSGSVVTVTGPNASVDVIDSVCVGN